MFFWGEGGRFEFKYFYDKMGKTYKPFRGRKNQRPTKPMTHKTMIVTIQPKAIFPTWSSFLANSQSSKCGNLTSSSTKVRDWSVWPSIRNWAFNFKRLAVPPLKNVIKNKRRYLICNRIRVGLIRLEMPGKSGCPVLFGPDTHMLKLGSSRWCLR